MKGFNSMQNFLIPKAVERWQSHGAECMIVPAPAFGILPKLGAFRNWAKWNGYATFPPSMGLLAENRLWNVPVPGGVTLRKQWDDGSVTYGFDCMNSESLRMANELEWMRMTCDAMAGHIAGLYAEEANAE
jgi:hypothetical protein